MIMQPVLADAGVPMIFLEMPAMLIALIPVIIIETLIAKRLTKLNWKPCGAGIALANLGSTFIGIPLAWGLMLGLEILTTGGTALGITNPLHKLAAVTLQAAWLIPYEEHFYWMVPSATVMLLIPTFLISVWVERFICLRIWKDTEHKTATRAVWMANTISYAILMTIAWIWLVCSIVLKTQE
jgi:hypothetical protein